LGNLHELSFGRREPVVDVVFKRRFDDRFAVAADERKNLDALLHGTPLAGVVNSIQITQGKARAGPETPQFHLF
jgi:hypothetical protein